MAKIDNDSLLNLLTGMLGKQIVVKKSKSGKPYLSSRPETDPNRTLTPPQAKYRNRFRTQAAYAKAVTSQPDIKKLYMSKARPGCSAYIMAWMDAHYPPAVKGIIYSGYHGRVGDIIYIQAQDDFMVDAVYVSIFDSSNRLLEKGKASFENETTWLYKTTSNVKGSRIEAIAYDRPGNKGTLSLDI